MIKPNQSAISTTMQSAKLVALVGLAASVVAAPAPGPEAGLVPPKVNWSNNSQLIYNQDRTQNL